MPDALILDAVRTPIGRYGGVLSGVRPDDLAAHVVKAAVERTGLDPASVDELYMGHPLGCSGARLLGTLAHELRRRGARYGVATMCIGVGQGLAAVIENPAA